MMELNWVIIILAFHGASISVLSFGLIDLSSFTSLVLESPEVKTSVPFCLGLNTDCLTLTFCNYTPQIDNTNVTNPAGECVQGNSGASINFGSSILGFPVITISPTSVTPTVFPNATCNCPYCRASCFNNPLINCGMPNQSQSPADITSDLTQFPSVTASFCQSINPQKQCVGSLFCNLQASTPGVAFSFPTLCLQGKATISVDPNSSMLISAQLSNITYDLLGDGSCLCNVCSPCGNLPFFNCSSNTTTTTTASPCVSTTCSYYQKKKEH